MLGPTSLCIYIPNLTLKYLYCRLSKIIMCIPHIRSERVPQYFFVFKISLVGQFAVIVILGSMEIHIYREKKKPDEVRKAIFCRISSLFHLLSISFSKGDASCSSPFPKWHQEDFLQGLKW